MIEAGDIYRADLNEDRRWLVLVVSNDRFHRLAGRVLVAPEFHGSVGTVAPPWRVAVDAHVFAVDLLRSVPADRLLERIDRAPVAVMKTVEHVLRQIT